MNDTPNDWEGADFARRLDDMWRKDPQANAWPTLEVPKPLVIDHGWQPIETVPDEIKENGVCIDVFDGVQRIPDVYWGERDSAWVDIEGWCVVGDGGWICPVMYITHWMLTPEPPKGE